MNGRILEELVPPTGLVASISSLATGQVDLSWSAATGPYPIIAYWVRRAGSTVGSTASLSYTELDVPESAWSYQVVAQDQLLNYAESEPLTVWADWTMPSAVTDLVVQPLGPTMRLTWSPATDNLAVAYYQIEQIWLSFDGTTGSSSLMTVSEPGLQLGPLTAGSYRYYLWTVDQAGNRSEPAVAESSLLTWHRWPALAPGQPVRRQVYPGGLPDRWYRTGEPMPHRLMGHWFDQVLREHGSWWAYARLDWERPCHHDDYRNEGDVEPWHEGCLGQGYRIIWHKVRARDMNQGQSLSLPFNLTEERIGQVIFTWAWTRPRPRDLIFEVDWDLPDDQVAAWGQPVHLLSAYQINHVDYPKGWGGRIVYARMFAHPLEQPWERYEQALRHVSDWQSLRPGQPWLERGLQDDPIWLGRASSD